MNSIRINELIDRFFDCDLAGEDRASLERTLLASPQARDLFWQKADVHALLRKWGRSHWGRVAAAGGEQDRPNLRSPRWMWTGAWRPTGAAIAAVAASLLAVLIGIGWGASARRTSEPSTQPQLRRAAVSVQRAFAVLSAAFEPVWADSNVGLLLQAGSLPAGPLELLSGRIELMFESGGTAVIEGPAIVEPIASDALRLSRGSIRCRCPEPGTELRVETPTSMITDLGTEFAVSVEADTLTRVGVIEGKVRVDMDEASKFVSAGEALSIDREGRTTDDIGFWKDFSAKAMLTPFDQQAFTTGRNLLGAPSFDIPRDASLSTDILRTLGNQRDFTLGPWRGTAGHVDLIPLGADGHSRAIQIHANGSPFWPLVSQQVDMRDAVGKTIMASIHAMRTHEDPLSDPQRAIVKLNFIDADGREFASAERHFLRARGPIDRFVEGKLAAEVPPGTVAVRFQALLTAAGLSTGSIVVDDAKMVIADTR